MRAARSTVGKNVMSGSSRNLGRGARRQLQMRDVINGYRDAVLLAPLRCKTIEPFIVLRHEMAPLEDLERLGLCKSARHKRRRKRGRQTRSSSRGAHLLQEPASC